MKTKNKKGQSISGCKMDCLGCSFYQTKKEMGQISSKKKIRFGSKTKIDKKKCATRKQNLATRLEYFGRIVSKKPKK